MIAASSLALLGSGLYFFLRGESKPKIADSVLVKICRDLAIEGFVAYNDLYHEARKIRDKIPVGEDQKIRTHLINNDVFKERIQKIHQSIMLKYNVDPDELEEQYRNRIEKVEEAKKWRDRVLDMMEILVQGKRPIIATKADLPEIITKEIIMEGLRWATLEFLKKCFGLMIQLTESGNFIRTIKNERSGELSRVPSLEFMSEMLFNDVIFYLYKFFSEEQGLNQDLYDFNFIEFYFIKKDLLFEEDPEFKDYFSYIIKIHKVSNQFSYSEQPVADIIELRDKLFEKLTSVEAITSYLRSKADKQDYGYIVEQNEVQKQNDAASPLQEESQENANLQNLLEAGEVKNPSQDVHQAQTEDLNDTKIGDHQDNLVIQKDPQVEVDGQAEVPQYKTESDALDQKSELEKDSQSGVKDVEESKDSIIKAHNEVTEGYEDKDLYEQD